MSASSTTALVLSCAIDAVVMMVCLATAKSSKLGLPRLALAVLLGLVAAAVKVVLLVRWTGSFFYGVALVYTDLMVVVPLVGVFILLLAQRRSVTASLKWAALASFLLVPFGLYATFVEPFRLKVERPRIPVSRERRGQSDLHVAVLADIQSREVSAHLREAVQLTMEFEPHLILLPGDLIQRRPQEYREAIPAFRDLLRPLSAPLGVYFVIGNTDDPARVAEVFEGTAVRMLENEWVEKEWQDRRVLIGGTDFNPWAGATEEFVGHLENRPGDDLRILCAHYPDVVYALSPGTRIDLVVAGHTHGGQVQVPFFGPPITLTTVPRYVAAGGYHRLDERPLYVSRGLGCERGFAPRVRFLAPPELSLLTLAAE